MGKPKPIDDDMVEIPPALIKQNKDLINFLYIMIVNKMPVLSGIESIIKY